MTTDSGYVTIKGMETSLANVDDSLFWSWLAGFSDGEACFALRLSGGHGRQTYTASFVLGLRADDWRLLQAIQRRTGLGYLRSIPRKDGNPQVTWTVTATADCAALATGLRRGCCLFSKKRRDFDLWSQAVDLLMIHGGGQIRSAAAAELAVLKENLHGVKRYSEDFADGWAERQGRRSTPRPSVGPRTRHARAAKRFWNEDRGTAEKLIRQKRYARLSQEQVNSIVDRALAGERRVDLAKEYGVSRQLIDNILAGKALRRDGTLAPTEKLSSGLKPSDPEFWKSEAGQRAHRNQAILRGKLTQAQIDEIVQRYEDGGTTMNALAAEFGVSRPLISKFIKGNYIRRD